MDQSPSRVIDERVKDEILHYPTVELIKKLFPDVKMHGRTLMCNPLRGERHPSLSCYPSRSGIPMWKDHATGECGDNIEFFRKVYPALDYPEAVERLSGMLFGRSPFVSDASVPAGPVVSFRAALLPSPEPEGMLKVLSVSPLLSGRTPGEMAAYWRGRGISDAVAGHYCSLVEYENAKVRGRSRVDAVSGLPILDDNGVPVVSDGRFCAMGFPNDIGGWSLRTPDADGRKGFKGCTMSSVSTLFGDGSFCPADLVKPYGSGQGYVENIVYIERSGLLLVNPGQGFSGVTSEAYRLALPLLQRWNGRHLAGRDMRAVSAVLSSLGGGRLSEGVTVVEGMFDALSVIERNRMGSLGPVPGTDLVVLNSVSNIPWAVPFLAAHRQVYSLLDVDLNSSAGQKAFARLESEVKEYSKMVGTVCEVINGSGSFYPHKDVNEHLMSQRGFDVAPPSPSPGRKNNGPGL